MCLLCLLFTQVGRTPTTSAQLTCTVCEENERCLGEGSGKSPIAYFTIGDTTLIFLVSVKSVKLNLSAQRIKLTNMFWGFCLHPRDYHYKRMLVSQSVCQAIIPHCSTAISAEHRLKYAALQWQLWCLHISVKVWSGPKNLKQTNKQTNWHGFPVKCFVLLFLSLHRQL